jgi:hypothetical protein
MHPNHSVDGKVLEKMIVVAMDVSQIMLQHVVPISNVFTYGSHLQNILKGWDFLASLDSICRNSRWLG